MKGQPDAPTDAARPCDAHRPGDGRADAVCADDEGRLDDDRRTAGRAARRDPARPDRRDARPRPDVDPGMASEVEERRIECRAVEPDGRRPQGAVIAVRQPEGAPLGRLDAHRGDRPDEPGKDRPVEPGSPQFGDGRRRGEHAAGPPAVGG